jgi:hypothetical protein
MQSVTYLRWTSVDGKWIVNHDIYKLLVSLSLYRKIIFLWETVPLKWKSVFRIRLWKWKQIYTDPPDCCSGSSSDPVVGGSGSDAIQKCNLLLVSVCKKKMCSMIRKIMLRTKCLSLIKKAYRIIILIHIFLSLLNTFYFMMFFVLHSRKYCRCNWFCCFENIILFSVWIWLKWPLLKSHISYVDCNSRLLNV